MLWNLLKKHKVLTVIGCILLAVILFFAVINVIPPKKNVENNPFVVEEGELPMIAAHRGGRSAIATVDQLFDMGVDCIMTDAPALLSEILDEYRNK